MITHFEDLMKEAIGEAKKALAMGEVPVGAILADSAGTIVARAHNRPITLNDPTAHAEMMVLRAGGAYYKNYRLTDTTLVVTIEPCLMCMGAAINARIARLVFGAFDPKAGAAGSLYDLGRDNRLNHRIEVVHGILEEECRKSIQDFFSIRREKGNTALDL